MTVLITLVEFLIFIFYSRKESGRLPPFETVTDSTGRVRRRAIFSDNLEEDDDEDDDGTDDNESDSDDNMSDEDESEEEIIHEMEPPRKKSKVCKQIRKNCRDDKHFKFLCKKLIESKDISLWNFKKLLIWRHVDQCSFQ